MPGSTLYFRNYLYFDESALGEAQSADAGACRLGGEILAVNGVECCEVVDVMQEACGLDYLCQIGASFGKYCLEIFAYLLGLRFYSAFSDVAGSRNYCDLTGGVNHVAYYLCLGVGSDCCWGIVGVNVFHSCSPFRLVDYFETGFCQSRSDLIEVVEVSGFHLDTQVAAVDVGIADMLVVNADDIAAESGDDPGNAEQLTGLVHKLNVEQGSSAGLDKTAVNDTGQDCNVDVTAGNQADYLLALYGDLVEHRRCNGNGAGALGDELLLLNEREDSGCDLVVGYCNDFVNVLAANVESVLTGFFYLDSIGDSGYIVKAFNFAVPYGVDLLGAPAACTP